MIDSGATGLGFIDKTYAHENILRMTRLEKYIDLYGFDGSQITSGRITHAVQVHLKHKEHKEDVILYVTTLGKHLIILGLPWMKKHEVVLDWKTQKVLFTAETCKHQHRPVFSSMVHSQRQSPIDPTRPDPTRSELAEPEAIMAV